MARATEEAMSANGGRKINLSKCWHVRAKDLRSGVILHCGPYRPGKGFRTVGDDTPMVIVTARQYAAIRRALKGGAK